jgi:signal transduction histidine kinase
VVLRDIAHRKTAQAQLLRDITERQQANEALKQQRDELRQLSARLTHVREEERRHLSRELHDELGQHLTAIRIELAAMERDSDTALRPRLADLMGRVDTIVTSVRRIAADLRPAMLDDLGLEAALEWLMKDWASRGQTTMHYTLEPLDVALSDSAKTAVYRIVQEALTNVSRHAQASEVQVSLQREGPALHIVVEDDGVGLAPDATHKRHSHGLRGIRERARALGGRAEMSSRSPRGFRLSVHIPFERVDSNLGELQEPCP